MSSSRKSMVMYYDMIDLLERMDGEDAKQLVLSMLIYSRDGVVPDHRPDIDLVFTLLKAQIDRDNDRYDDTVKKRSDAGRKGGKASDKQNKQAEANAYFAKQTEQMQTNEANAKQNKQMQTNQANASFAKQNKQMQTNQAVAVAVADAVADADIYKSSISSDPQPDPPKRAHDPVPYQKVVDLFNSICTKLPKVQSLNDVRRRAIAARYKEHGMDELEKAFALVEASAFLTGGSFACGFDWVMKQQNLQKILEGSYDDKPGQRASPKKTSFHNFEGRGTDYEAYIYGGSV